MERFFSTCALGLLAICLGSVTACGVGRLCAMVSVLMVTTIAKWMKGRRMQLLVKASVPKIRVAKSRLSSATSAAKAALFYGLYGSAEAEPFQNASKGYATLTGRRALTGRHATGIKAMPW